MPIDFQSHNDSGIDFQEMQPADSSKEMQDAQYWVNHPYMKAMKDTGDQALVNPVVQGINSLEPTINGVEKFDRLPEDQRLKPLQGPDMTNAPMAARVLGNVSGGITKGLVATGMGGGNPFIGYGVMSGIEGYGNGENPIGAAIKGAASAIPQYYAGKFGSGLASAAAKPIGGAVSKIAPNVGTALGMGTASAAEAGITGGNPLEAAATGATFGAMSPMNPLGSKAMTEAQYNDLMNTKGASLYRSILNPGKDIINKLEIKSGKDIDDSMALAAKHGLPINSNKGTIDNIDAIDKVKSLTSPLYSQLDNMLASNPEKQFNLDDIAKKAINQFNDPKSPNYIKNALEADNAGKKVQNEIDAEILRNGKSPLVNGQQLNSIKQGMWSKSYNPLEPNANDAARQAGFTMKDSLEKAYPDQSIKDLNDKTGQYLTLQRILEKTHGKNVKGGALGNHLAGAIGGGAGLLAGKVIPIPVVGEAIGGAAGIAAGENAGKFINDPNRITSNWNNKINRINLPQSPLNPLKNSQQGAGGIPNGVKALGVAGAVGLGSVLNPMNSQAQDSDRLNLPSPQYTQKEEGFKGMPYIDTKGNKTVGYGFKMDGPASKYIPQSVHDGKRSLTKEEATGIFNKLYPQAIETAQKFSGDNWSRLSNNQKKSLTDMAYQLGSSKLNNFKNLKEAVQRGHFNTAAREILNSDYANDAKNRAQRNSQLILS